MEGNIYYKALLEKYMNGTASVSEVNDLFEELNTTTDQQGWELLLAEILTTAKEDLTYNTTRWESAIQHILDQKEETISEPLLAGVSNSADVGFQPMPPTRRIHFLRTSWFRYAAAVIIVLGVGSYFWVRNTQRSTLNAQYSMDRPQDIAPGTNRAILTVDNQSINLSNNKTGIAINNTIAYNDGASIEGLSPLSVRRGAGGEAVTLSTPLGGQYQIVLPDGTKVWLNAASSIQFPSKFTGNERSVRIIGEAYLEVAKNTKQPFYVHTTKETIQVLGTSFNVNAYTDEEAEKTTLIEGSVRVLPVIPLVKGGRGDLSHNQGDVLLKPGQQASLTDGRLSVADDQEEAAIAWKSGLFKFKDATIKSIMRQLSRWYDVDVQYEDNVPERRFLGEMRRSMSLAAVLRVLESSDVHFSVEGKRIIVKP